jgi:ElaB/YqjD/DUF883 family membrane-anchored ribosome-binding protein
MKTHTQTNHSHSQTTTHRGDDTHLMDDARSLLTATAGVAGAKVQEARERLMAAVDSGKRSAVASAKATDRVIRANPYRSIAIAAGVGAVIGYFMTRRDSSSRTQSDACNC